MNSEDYSWETNYQIGPETLLLATRDADFNARVRDYRRELWGDGAPLVHEGILGYRNADISVRERRRFTDLLRQEPGIAKSVETVTEDMCAKHVSALRRDGDELDLKAVTENQKNLYEKDRNNLFEAGSDNKSTESKLLSLL